MLHIVQDEIIQPGVIVEMVIPAEALAEIPESERRFTIDGDTYIVTAG